MGLGDQSLHSGVLGEMCNNGAWPLFNQGLSPRGNAGAPSSPTLWHRDNSIRHTGLPGSFRKILTPVVGTDKSGGTRLPLTGNQEGHEGLGNILGSMVGGVRGPLSRSDLGSEAGSEEGWTGQGRLSWDRQ